MCPTPPSAWALAGSCNACRALTLQSSISPEAFSTSPGRGSTPTLPVGGSLTAHPWSIPSGVWGPPRSGTPAPPLHQPGPAPPEQPRLQARKVGLGARKGGGRKILNPYKPRLLQGLCMCRTPAWSPFPSPTRPSWEAPPNPWLDRPLVCASPAAGTALSYHRMHIHNA